MRTTLATLALGASLIAAPALAQPAAPGAHHPPATASGAPAAAPATAGGTMHAMPGAGAAGTGMGMMACPMMQGGMAGMPGPAAQPRADQSVASLAFDAVNAKMHAAMAIDDTGDADQDFARAMIAHHQGAVDMAKVVIGFGADPDIRAFAAAVVAAQEDEIRVLRAWLAAHAPR